MNENANINVSAYRVNDKEIENLKKQVEELKERNFRYMEENMRLRKLVQAQAELIANQLK